MSRADTFHLAICYMGSEEEGGTSGCDISHRGGPPGFVQLKGDGTLVWADYVGKHSSPACPFPYTSPLDGGVQPQMLLLFCRPAQICDRVLQGSGRRCRCPSSLPSSLLPLLTGLRCSQATTRLQAWAICTPTIALASCSWTMTQATRCS